MAIEIGVTPRTLRRWLHGQTVNIHMPHLEALADRLGCRPQDLISVSAPAEDSSVSSQAETLEHPFLSRLASLMRHGGKHENFEEATRLLTQSSKLLTFEQQADALFQYARFAFHLGQYAAAKQAFERAILKADAAGADQLRLRAFLGLSKLAEYDQIDAETQELFLAQAEHILIRIQATHWRPYLWLMESRNALKAGAYSKALHLAEQAMSQLDQMENRSSLDYLEALDIAASVFEAVGKRRKSVDILMEAEQLSHGLLTEQHPMRGRLFLRLSATHRLLGKLELAKDNALHAINIFENCLGPGHHEVLAKAWMTVGSAYVELGSHDRSLAAYQEGLARTLGSGTGNVDLEARLRFNLGLVLSRSGRLEESAAEGLKAIQLFTLSSGPEHPETAAAIGRYAGALQLQDKHQEAITLYSQATDLLVKSDRFHVRILDQVRNQAKSLLALGRHHEAAALLEQHKVIYSVRDEGPLYRGQYALLQSKALAVRPTRKKAALELAYEARTVFQNANINGPILYEADRLVQALKK